MGQECFKVQFGDLTLAFNPPSKASSYKVNKFGANIVLQSIEHEDMNGGEDFAYGDKKPFVISGPGEYETGGIFINGIQGETNYGDEKRINTIYSLTVDGISMLFLGPQSAPLPSNLSAIVDTVDLVFVPVGGNGAYEPKEAYKVASNLEPKMIIPMHFKNEKDEALHVFLKEAGEKLAAVDKLTIKKKDLEGKDEDVVVLSPQA